MKYKEFFALNEASKFELFLKKEGVPKIEDLEREIGEFIEDGFEVEEFMDTFIKDLNKFGVKASYSKTKTGVSIFVDGKDININL